MHEQIRQVVAEHGRLAANLAAVSDDDDLFNAGMTSHASVSVMLALEDRFDLEFPDEMLSRSVFCSVSSIAAAIDSLRTRAS